MVHVTNTGSVSLSMACVGTKGQTEVDSGLGCHLGPCQCTKVVLLLGLYKFELPVLPPGALVFFQPRLLSKAMSRSSAGPQPQSVWISVALKGKKKV